MDIIVQTIIATVQIGIAIFQIWIAFWMFRKQNIFQKKADQFIKESTSTLKNNTQKIFDLIVGLKQDFLRLFMEVIEAEYNRIPEDNEYKQYMKEKMKYWRFKYRFETEDILILTVQSRDNSQTFNLHLKVYGTTETLKKDHQGCLYYLCDVIKSGSQKDFNVNDKVACYFFEGSICVSKEIHLGFYMSANDFTMSIYRASIINLNVPNEKLVKINVSSMSENDYYKIPKDFKLK